MTEEIPFQNELRKSLLEAAQRKTSMRKSARQQRRRRIITTASCLVTVTAAAIGAMQLRPQTSDAQALDITKTSTQISVTLHELNASPAEIQKELRAAGLQASVKTEPAAPVQVGKFLALSTSQHVVTSYTRDNPEGFETFTLSPNDHTVQLIFGKPARGDESYASSIDAFLPGEPLHCSGLQGSPVEKAADVFQTKGFKVHWQRYTGKGFTPSNPDDSAGKVILSVSQSAAHELSALVGDPGDQPFVAPLHNDDC